MNSIADLYKDDKSCQDDIRIKIYPDILIAAARGANGGAAKLWALAKHANPGGCGSIPNKALRQYVINDLGVWRGTYDVWFARALKIKLLERQDNNIKRTSVARAAVIVGAEHVKRPVYIDLSKFIKTGWLAGVWAAWLISNKLTDKPISRAALRVLSGIPGRCQLDYEKLAGVYNRHNYSKHEGINTKEAYYYLSQEKKRPVFDYQGQVMERLPNSREVNDQSITLAPKGRTRRVNSQLKDLLNIGGQDPKNTITRLYCQGDKQTKATLKHIARQDIKGVPGLPEWVHKKANKKGFWHAIPA